MASGQRNHGRNTQNCRSIYSPYRIGTISERSDPEFVPVSTFFKNRGMHPFLRELPFEEWWQKDVIFFEGGNLARRELTRKRLVFTLRNQKGGSHFDSQVRDRDYLSLRDPVPFVVPGAGCGDMHDLGLATMRQIAEELELSIEIYEWQQRLRRNAGGWRTQVHPRFACEPPIFVCQASPTSPLVPNHIAASLNLVLRSALARVSKDGRTAREAWVRVPGKHRNKDAAWAAVENMIATRH